MPTFERIRGRQLIREAEGYLELLYDGLDMSIRPQVRDQLAQRAIRTLRKLEISQVQGPHVQFLIGQALAIMGRHGEAAVAYERAAELDPDNIEIWLNLGESHRRCNRLDLAIQAMEEALEINRSHPEVHYRLARYWSLAHSPKLAVAYLAQSLEIDPQLRDQARGEADFERIRNHPDFVAVTNIVA